MSLTNRLIPTHTNMLQALAAWLDKARAEKGEEEAETLLSARLAPDMYPLATQVRFACLQAQEPAYRLTGRALPETLMALAREGQDAGNTPGTIAGATARIDEALAFLKTLAPDAYDAGADQTVSLELPNGMVFDMSGEDYVRDWALAQFYFHVMTAYAILRGEGVALGKADYVKHIFSYLRPGTMPERA